MADFTVSKNETRNFSSAVLPALLKTEIIWKCTEINKIMKLNKIGLFFDRSNIEVQVDTTATIVKTVIIVVGI